MTMLCDICKQRAMFDGFGHHFCWQHYSEWIRGCLNSGTIESHVRSEANKTLDRQKTLW